jgi:MYXO-CTERM domain-containing protein
MRAARLSARPFALSPLLALALGLCARPALAQDAGAPDDGGTPATDAPPCPSDALGCAAAPIHYDHRVGSPVEFDFDTGWVPASSPVQIRFHTALQGHTEVTADGVLQGSWPQTMTLHAIGTRAGGLLQSDYGVVLDASIRLHLTVDGATYDWQGSIPYVPHIDFRAMASQRFDPWAWGSVTASGETMRQHIADVNLTSAIISIPGISGGLSFDAQASLTTGYHSTQITFAGDADPITERNEYVMAYFSSGAQIEYFPRLEGHVDWSGTVTVFPSLYISLLGHRWMYDIAEIPVPFGPASDDWLFDPSPAVLDLPDVVRDEIVLDFGEVPVGTRARDGVPFQSVGRVDLWVGPPTAPAAPFTFPESSLTIPPRTTASLPVEFVPAALGPVEQRVAFRTSDPDTPSVYVTLRGTGIEPTVTDAGSDAGDAGVASDAHGDVAGDANPGAQAPGCGCHTAGHDGSGARDGYAGIAVAVACGAVARRRRRGRA